MSDRQYTIATVGERVESFLKNVTAAAGLKVSIELVDGDEAKAYFEHPTLVVRFSGRDVDYLMANKGEGLLALEQLTQEVLGMRADEHALICFDANDFRLLRQEELRLSALTIAERVRKSRVPYRFSPMTSRERRLLHLALRDEKDLRTESSGMGPSRHVVVYPADAPSLPELPAQAHSVPHGRPPRRGR
jgi:spoIIIJ-associated protein